MPTTYAAQLAALPRPWPVLQLGTQQWFVKLLRRVLAERGYGDATWRNSSIAVSDYFDTGLQHLVKQIQAAAGLEADGIVGPKTWLLLAGDNPHTAPYHADTVAAAAKLGKVAELGAALMIAYMELLVELGVSEHGGPNRGEVVDAIERHVLGHSGEPWCAMTVDFCYEQACRTVGMKPLMNIGASSSAFHTEAERLGLLIPVARSYAGCGIILAGGPTGWHHTLAQRAPVLSSGVIPTVEGNVGDAIRELTRDPRKTPLAVVDLWGLRK